VGQPPGLRRAPPAPQGPRDLIAPDDPEHVETPERVDRREALGRRTVELVDELVGEVAHKSSDAIESLRPGTSNGPGSSCAALQVGQDFGEGPAAAFLGPPAKLVFADGDLHRLVERAIYPWREIAD